mmetsp:Transcript_24092/g.37178  ORF Transcript_24092/g.37178 Transcript_24092/m.37178 type:complete len:245 (+) Transcript_24092:110-844(+)|eukprot:CAMPEP_0196815656 /NCGR_PEP_ID=MMETSP1362-20130617/51049_1 /TAXON_ID=163516 /ORGANISM="Leptocylindrus danicus, Strain CCMP1856" /LENGTH=244 /DNA_ID=CAMNT_0042192701 /DNA_START=80 /DNA_END=814 /DNA_ORIENTATION=-
MNQHNLRASEEMCHFCFDVLVGEIVHQRQRGNASEPTFINSLPHPTVQCPLFVTWDKRRSSSSLLRGSGDSNAAFELRGCIGTLSPRPLVEAMRELALTSALQDRRFPPISKHELPSLRVGVSLLVQYEECADCFDWQVGTHGIMISFTISRSSGSMEYSATYLPEVAYEQGWTQIQAVKSLIRKAGYYGDINDDLFGRINCTRYQSSKVKATYDDFVQLNGGVDPLNEVLSTTKRSGFSRFFS